MVYQNNNHFTVSSFLVQQVQCIGYHFPIAKIFIPLPYLYLLSQKNFYETFMA